MHGYGHGRRDKAVHGSYWNVRGRGERLPATVFSAFICEDRLNTSRMLFKDGRPPFVYGLSGNYQRTTSQPLPVGWKFGVLVIKS